MIKLSQAKDRQSGFTLIELLLYVALVGMLLTSLTYFFGTMVDSRVKDQSILEVNEQGTVLMDYLTQTIRNATSITSPTAGLSGPSLTLVVPTGGLSPTIFNLNGTTLGYSTTGTTLDTAGSNFMNATKFVASATGTVSTLNALVGPTVAASPNNKGQMAIYSGTASPTTLLASSASTTLIANVWNDFNITPVNITSGQTYWLVYNTNGLASADNDLLYHTGTAGQTMFLAQTFGSWPASWTGTAQTAEFSMYAMVDAANTPGTVQVKEGAGALVSLTNNKLRVSGLVFNNLTRPATPGIVQISFTVWRLNPNNRNEYDYAKTFTSSAELAW